jgi:hypothetical protein
MKSETYPLSLPPDLLGEVRETAKETGLSLADAMRQSLKLGLPKLREQLAPQTGLKPFTKEEAAKAFGPDPEFDALYAAMVKRGHQEPKAFD